MSLVENALTPFLGNGFVSDRFTAKKASQQGKYLSLVPSFFLQIALKNQTIVDCLLRKRRNSIVGFELFFGGSIVTNNSLKPNKFKCFSSLFLDGVKKKKNKNK